MFPLVDVARKTFPPRAMLQQDCVKWNRERKTNKRKTSKSGRCSSRLGISGTTFSCPSPVAYPVLSIPANVKTLWVLDQVCCCQRICLASSLDSRLVSPVEGHRHLTFYKHAPIHATPLSRVWRLTKARWTCLCELRQPLLSMPSRCPRLATASRVLSVRFVRQACGDSTEQEKRKNKATKTRLTRPSIFQVQTLRVYLNFSVTSVLFLLERHLQQPWCPLVTNGIPKGQWGAESHPCTIVRKCYFTCWLRGEFGRNCGGLDIPIFVLRAHAVAIHFNQLVQETKMPSLKQPVVSAEKDREGRWIL